MLVSTLEQMYAKVVAHGTVFLTSGATWTVPANVTMLTSVECIGSGGAGAGMVAAGGASSVTGGGGGGYSKSVNIVVSPGQVINIGVGLGGAAVVRTTVTRADGLPGGDTWFNAISAADAASKGATIACAAKGA